MTATGWKKCIPAKLAGLLTLAASLVSEMLEVFDARMVCSVRPCSTSRASTSRKMLALSA